MTLERLWALERKAQGPTVFARSPSPPQPVVVGPYMSNFELFYYLITSNYYLVTSYKHARLFLFYCLRYCLLFITATPIRRLRCAVTRTP